MSQDRWKLTSGIFYGFYFWPLLGAFAKQLVDYPNDSPNLLLRLAKQRIDARMN
jgi:hypothetical protein